MRTAHFIVMCKVWEICVNSDFMQKKQEKGMSIVIKTRFQTITFFISSLRYSTYVLEALLISCYLLISYTLHTMIYFAMVFSCCKVIKILKLFVDSKHQTNLVTIEESTDMIHLLFLFYNL